MALKLDVPAADLETYLGFLDESRDHLDSMEQKVLGLAENPDPDIVNALFRALHTIKGIAGFLSLVDIQKLSHRLESVFDAIRQDQLAVGERLIRCSLENIDNLTAMIRNLETGLARREDRLGGGWVVTMEDVDFAAGYAELGVLLGTPVPEKSIQPAVEPAEESLITPQMQAAFVKESLELLEATEQVFLHLSENPDDAEGIAQVFRNIHTFKGNAGFFGYSDLEQMSHRLENVLDDYRTRKAPLAASVAEFSLQCLDIFQTTVDALGRGQSPGIPGLPEWLARLDKMDLSASSPPLGEILVRENQATPDGVDFALSLQKRPLGEVMIDEGLATPAAVTRALEIQAKAIPTSASGATKPIVREAKRDLRVDLAKLDQLMDLVGELVISTGMILNHQIFKASNAPDLEKIAHQLRGVVSDLQSVALGVRMVPIDGTFRKMTRLVHDLSSKVGKKVRLEFKGEETEVDKTVVDLIADPLVHMIRNSIDHGLEAMPDRVSAGKDAMGVVTLEAGQEGGEILITIRDDGRGMNRDRILAKAVERGLVEPGQADLSDNEVFQFIFKAGFSTAEAVTATSGRGVGMDVVKSNIDKLGGRIHIASQAGAGSAITLRIPLTLSIIEGMMVRVGESLFILPLTAVKESLAPRPDQIFTLAGGQEMLMLRGKSLPIFRLGRMYGIPGSLVSLTQGLLIHLEAREARFCLAVDDLLGQRQVVVKALPGFMSKVPGASSCSILDNGEIALILDVTGLAQLQGRDDSPRSAAWKSERRVA